MSDETYNGPERRRYYRLVPSSSEKLQADFYFLQGKHCQAEVVNLSPGGLLCYLETGLEYLGVGVIIPRIDIRIPYKPVVTYAGEILRIQHAAQGKVCFCAIQFIKYGGLKDRLKASSGKIPRERRQIPDAVFLKRLQEAEDYTQLEDIEKEIIVRNQVYQSFNDIAEALPLEERWFFYEILDEMKRCEPNYPEGMKREFLRLCRAEIRPSANRKRKLVQWVKDIFAFFGYSRSQNFSFPSR